MRRRRGCGWGWEVYRRFVSLDVGFEGAGFDATGRTEVGKRVGRESRGGMVGWN